MYAQSSNHLLPVHPRSSRFDAPWFESLIFLYWGIDETKSMFDEGGKNQRYQDGETARLYTLLFTCLLKGSIGGAGKGAGLGGAAREIRHLIVNIRSTPIEHSTVPHVPDGTSNFTQEIGLIGISRRRLDATFTHEKMKKCEPKELLYLLGNQEKSHNNKILPVFVPVLIVFGMCGIVVANPNTAHNFIFILSR